MKRGLACARRAARLGAGVVPVLALVAFTGCREPDRSQGKRDGDAGTVVARVNGAPVSSWMLDATRAHRRQPLGARLEAAIARRLLAEEARRRGLAEDDAVLDELPRIRTSARAREEEALQEALLARLRDEVELSETDLAAHYEASKTRFLERRWRLRRSSAYATREAAEAAPAPLEPEEEEIGPSLPQELPAEARAAALALRRPGERTLVETAEGWQVLELLEITTTPRPLADVRDEVARSLRAVRAQEAYRALVETLRAQAEIEIDEEVLRKLEADAAANHAGATSRETMRRGATP